MPGPMLTLVIGAVLAQGFWAAPAILAGHALLELLAVSVLLLGLSAALQRRTVRVAIGIVGGMALLWMGADMLRVAGELSLSSDAQPRQDPWWALALGGAAVCLANPYFLGWWATIGTGQMAHLGLRGRLDYLAFYAGHELSDVVWYCLVAAALVAGKGLMSVSVYRGLVAACAIALLALGVWFVYSGARHARPKAAPL